MPDPTTHTVTAITVATSTASVTAGAFLGIEYTVFGVALLGASIAHIWLESMAFKLMIKAIFGSFVLGVISAKFFAGAILATASYFMPWLAGIFSPNDTAIAVAFAVSFIAQKVVPIIFSRLDKEANQ